MTASLAQPGCNHFPHGVMSKINYVRHKTCCAPEGDKLELQNIYLLEFLSGEHSLLLGIFTGQGSLKVDLENKQKFAKKT